jgi:hypothetical protein
MTTTYGTDPNTQTVAAAWAFSPLGQPEREVRYGFAEPGTSDPITADEEPPTAKRVMVAAGLACGIAAGALAGVMLFYSNSSQPTVVAPGPVPQHAVVVGPSTAAPAPEPVASARSTGPNVVAPAPKRGPGTTAVATSPVAPPPVAPQGGTTVVVDIPPKPPVPDDLGLKLPDPPKPDPKPIPPEFLPDLPLVPKPPKSDSPDFVSPLGLES